MWIRRVGPGCHVFTIMCHDLENVSCRSAIRKSARPPHDPFWSFLPLQQSKAAPFSLLLLFPTNKSIIVIWIWPESSFFILLPIFFFWCDNEFWQHTVSTEPISISSIIILNTVIGNHCYYVHIISCVSDAHDSLWLEGRMWENFIYASERGWKKLRSWGSILWCIDSMNWLSTDEYQLLSHTERKKWTQTAKKCLRTCVLHWLATLQNRTLWI